MKVGTLEKFHLKGGGNQDPGDTGVTKVRGGFFFLQAVGGGGLTMDDPMLTYILSFSQATNSAKVMEI